MADAVYKELSLPGNNGFIGFLTLSRPKHANAFSGEMMTEISHHLERAATNKRLRLLVVHALGKHFSAGADLGWMKESAKLSLSENLEDSGKLTKMFEQLANFPTTTLAIAKGAVYGGAVGILASCDIVLGYESSRFCLSEVKLGLLPGVILPYIMRKMSPAKVKRYGLTGKVFQARDAEKCGLIDEVLTPSLETTEILAEISNLLQAGPEAARKLKQLILEVESEAMPQKIDYQQAISKARVGTEGQNGLGAFFKKSSPDWHVTFRTKDDEKSPFEGELLDLIEAH